MDFTVRSSGEAGGLIKRLRADRDLSQQQLADRSNLSRTRISQIENGDQNPTLETFFTLVRCMDASVTVQDNEPNRETDRDDDEPTLDVGGISV